MLKTTRIQRQRTKGWRLPEGAIIVTRPTIWGNPFVVGRDGDLARCLEMYSGLAFGHIVRGIGATVAEQERAQAAMMRARQQLRGKQLACWCRLDRPCHADLLIALADG